MKTFKVLLILLTGFTALISCDEEVTETTVEPTVDSFELYGTIQSTAEYQTLNSDEKKLVDLMNAAFAGLSNFEDENYKAYISFSLEDSFLSNYVIFSNDEDSDFTTTESCRACGLTSGIKCAKKLLKSIEDGETIEVEITRDGKCFIVEW